MPRAISFDFVLWAAISSVSRAANAAQIEIDHPMAFR
jgi:hypothetical protein